MGEEALRLHEGESITAQKLQAPDAKKSFMKSMCRCESCKQMGQRHFLGRCPAQHAARAERVAKYEKRSEASITTAASKEAESKQDSRPLEKFFSDLEVLELKKHTKVLRDIEKIEKLPKLDKLQLEKVERKQDILKTTVMVKKASGYTIRPSN